MAYFLLRQVVFSFDQPEMQPTLRGRLRTFHVTELWTINSLCHFMEHKIDSEERIRQGMPETPFDFLDNADEKTAAWNFACDFLWVILCEKDDSMTWLKGLTTYENAGRWLNLN